MTGLGVRLHDDDVKHLIFVHNFGSIRCSFPSTSRIANLWRHRMSLVVCFFYKFSFPHFLNDRLRTLLSRTVAIVHSLLWQLLIKSPIKNIFTWKHICIWIPAPRSPSSSSKFQDWGFNFDRPKLYFPWELSDDCVATLHTVRLPGPFRQSQ